MQPLRPRRVPAQPAPETPRAERRWVSVDQMLRHAERLEEAREARKHPALPLSLLGIVPAPRRQPKGKGGRSSS